MFRRAYIALAYYLSTLANVFIIPKDNESEHPNTSYIDDISEEDSIQSEFLDFNLVYRRELLSAHLESEGWAREGNGGIL